MKLITTLAAGAAALLVAACGGASTNASSTTASSGNGADGAPAPASTAAPDAGAAVIKTRSGAPGAFLVDGRGRALYLWQADRGKASTCAGECARDWPPLTTTGAPKASGSVKSSLLGTTKRSDGTLEVTYAGHPLYRYAGDTAPGQVTGQGSDDFGAVWWIVQPDGNAITH